MDRYFIALLIIVIICFALVALAGQHDGCKIEGCTCPGNRKRGAQPHTAPPTRSW
jgi:hypothetical protein